MYKFKIALILAFVQTSLITQVSASNFILSADDKEWTASQENIPDSLLSCKHGRIYSGTTRLDDKTIQSIFSEHAEINDLYSSGRRNQNTGKGLLIAGISGSLVSTGVLTLGLIVDGNRSEQNYDDPNPYYIAGIPMAATFVTMTTVGVMLKIIGGNKVLGSVNLYNENRSGGETSMRYEFGVSANGLSISLIF